MCWRRRVLGLFLACAPALICGFNVDVDSKIVHSGPRGTCPKREGCMFGFAVAQHRERGTPW